MVEREVEEMFIYLEYEVPNVEASKRTEEYREHTMEILKMCG